MASIDIRYMIDVVIGCIDSRPSADMIDLKMRCVSKGFTDDFDRRYNIPARIRLRAERLEASTSWDPRRIAAKAADERRAVLQSKLPSAVSAHFDSAVDASCKATKKLYWKLSRIPTNPDLGFFCSWSEAFGCSFFSLDGWSFNFWKVARYCQEKGVKARLLLKYIQLVHQHDPTAYPDVCLKVAIHVAVGAPFKAPISSHTYRTLTSDRDNVAFSYALVVALPSLPSPLNLIMGFSDDLHCNALALLMDSLLRRCSPVQAAQWYRDCVKNLRLWYKFSSWVRKGDKKDWKKADGIVEKRAKIRHLMRLLRLIVD